MAVPGQLPLGLESEVLEACLSAMGKEWKLIPRRGPKRKRHPGRGELPAHIERNYIDIHPESIPAGAEHFDTIETEQLEYDPARLFATVYRRHKYKRHQPDGTIEFFIADLPAEKDKSLTLFTGNLQAACKLLCLAEIHVYRNAHLSCCQIKRTAPSKLEGYTFRALNPR